MIEPILVPVKTTSEDGQVTTKLEPWNRGGQQSDGAQYFEPKKLTEDDHEHFFEHKKPTDRHITCICGHGGLFFPHNADLKDGHVYTKDGKKVI